MTMVDTSAIAQEFLGLVLQGGDASSILTNDFVHYRNTLTRDLSREEALGDYASLRAACTSLRVVRSDVIATPQGVICEPRIEGETVSGAAIVLLPLLYVQIDNEGRIYRVDEFVDSAALRPLVEADLGRSRRATTVNNGR